MPIHFSVWKIMTSCHVVFTRLGIYIDLWPLSPWLEISFMTNLCHVWVYIITPICDTGKKFNYTPTVCCWQNFFMTYHEISVSISSCQKSNSPLLSTSLLLLSKLQVSSSFYFCFLGLELDLWIRTSKRWQFLDWQKHYFISPFLFKVPLNSTQKSHGASNINKNNELIFCNMTWSHLTDGKKLIVLP